ncbi:TetR/AcrR family transcriptional regulator [Actinokineospora bangkokensis]|uniref:TetR family transcriptional regulator n=1 Tax=Actinokineospora bangkokensis TaxID=1193682 RepID=A0A1Q9LQG8_9PSEU|nr:TetR family transcriptional regulator [Actinokineospora bangkokensis]OLR94243.1 TetR family transcriptional regulator [Actinokineospora bangkokensis]
MPGSGRRPGPTRTRAAVLRAARARFAEHGFAGTTIRAVAEAAGVTPALVHHFFGGKDRLFAEAMRLPLDPEAVVATVVQGPREQAGERVVRLFLRLWSTPEAAQAFLAVLRSVATTERAATMLRDFLEEAVLARVTDALGVSRLAATAMSAHLVGLAVLRHVVRVEPLASAPDEEVVALVGPVVQAYLGGGPP